MCCCVLIVVVVIVVMPQVVGAVVAFGECMTMAWKQNKLFYLKSHVGYTVLSMMMCVYKAYLH